jgi:hypothetical protein
MIQHRGSDCGIEQQHHDGIIEACTSNTWYRTAGRQGPCCLSPPTDLNVFKIHPHHVVIVELLAQALTGPTTRLTHNTHILHTPKDPQTHN